MENPEDNKNPFESTVSGRVEGIAFKAAEMPEFQKIVETSPNRLEMIKAIREELKNHFPEIAEIPEPIAGEAQRPIGGLPSNEFMIAKAIAELLYDKKD